jgi:hypothetical protein
MTVPKTTIRLEDGPKTTSLLVETDLVAGASMLLYKGDYFLFRGIEGRFFSMPSFVRCEPPVDVSNEPTTEPEVKG